MSGRERRVEAVAAVTFVAAAGALALWRTPSISPSVGPTVALVATYALLTRVRFAVGSGFTTPSQLALVPLLLLLPPALGPALVCAGYLTARAPELLTGRMPWERLLSSLADAWYIVAPATLLAVVAPRGALTATGWPLWLAALALQLIGDLVVSTLREALGAGVPPRLQVDVLFQVAVVDALLAPVGLLAAFASQTRPYGFLLVLPLVAGFWLFSRERAARIDGALALADDLERQRARLVVAQRRIGETAAASLDREALEKIILDTAVELVGAEAGRLTARSPTGGRAILRTSAHGGGALAELLSAVESSLGRGGVVQARSAPATAIGVSVGGGDTDPLVLSVARRHGDFSADERALLSNLAEQATVCLRNLALHERVQRAATTDELTGLLNHRRLQEVLRQESRRSERYGIPMSLIMLDIDNFKRVNDTYGHQRGDAVLRAVADAVRVSVRKVDFCARYGGEELAVVLPQLDLDRAVLLAERIRAAVAAVRVGLPSGGLLSVTASFGVATLDVRAPAPDRMVAEADAALYRAKRAGKNRVVVSGALAAHRSPTVAGDA